MKFNKRDHVWYVCYGSNMLNERFLCYLKGGAFRECSNVLPACEDNADDPLQRMPYILPYNMYYANTSSSWNGSAVSFLDITKPGCAYGAAYLISKKQFRHVCRGENGGHDTENASWYNAVVSLGTFDGIDVATLTNSRRLDRRSPSYNYLEVLVEGIMENYNYINNAEAWKYVKGC
ncbi:MAG: hypothetical protein LKJ83_01780 [Eubacteriaceae bacterium]|nr:hypothetical protein [Eubacteriaceae bacterium]